MKLSELKLDKGLILTVKLKIVSARHLQGLSLDHVGSLVLFATLRRTW